MVLLPLLIARHETTNREQIMAKTNNKIETLVTEILAELKAWKWKQCNFYIDDNGTTITNKTGVPLMDALDTTDRTAVIELATAVRNAGIRVRVYGAVHNPR